MLIIITNILFGTVISGNLSIIHYYIHDIVIFILMILCDFQISCKRI